MGNRKARVVIDEAILIRIAEGDNEALTDLYERTYKPVFALLLSCTQNYQDAEDLLQETYIKICQGAHLYVPRGNPMAWIMKIAKNLYISKSRRESVQKEENFEETANQIPFEHISQVEDRMLIETVFKELNKDERTVMILHVMQGFKFREVAEILDKPLGSVLSMYHRGLGKLRKALGEN